ncbi:MAG: hypothetical protein RMJ44_00215 [Cytophagales bacterium]|nr:hypothetical protein [Bernardetiaceae bacterium]MDW8209482.1 hypothetical protein [Cytophagales bacterium]
MFNPGEKVVCINADFSMYPNIWDVFKQLPKQDEIYTVRERQYVQGMGYRILLEEIHNPPVYVDLVKGMVEPAFAATRFARLSDPLAIKETTAVEEEIAV